MISTDILYLFSTCVIFEFFSGEYELAEGTTAAVFNAILDFYDITRYTINGGKNFP